MMSIENYLNEMKSIQTNLLDYLDYESDQEEKYQNLINIFDNIGIHENQYKLKLLLYLILKISKNHHRECNFFNKIEQILMLFKDDMKKFYSNSELFNVFKSNKRILLYLLDEKILFIDKYIIQTMTNYKYSKNNYPQYFLPEIKQFLNENPDVKNEFCIKNIDEKLPDNFFVKRKLGENDEYICNLIQNDMIEEFIIYVNKNFYSLNSIIKKSIYETNSLLLRGEINTFTLIEYASFYGAIQIFNYLRLNGVEISYLLFDYAIYGHNAEIIRFLEENCDMTHLNKNEVYIDLFKISIKCYHIDTANYIQSNYLQCREDNSYKTSIYSLKHYNFSFIQNEHINGDIIYDLCKYDYFLFIMLFIKEMGIDMNRTKINTIFF